MAATKYHTVKKRDGPSAMRETMAQTARSAAQRACRGVSLVRDL